jgi:oligopeptidase B
MAAVRLALAAALLLPACLKPAPRTASSVSADVPQPPSAPREPTVHELHGERRLDEYAWMRNRDSPVVLTYLEAENEYTRAMMQSTEATQQRLYEEFVARMRHPGQLLEVRRGEYSYYSRLDAGKTYPTHYRKRLADDDADEEVVLDLNALVQKDGYIDLGSFELSDDGDYLAYSIDSEGTRSYTLYIKDLRSGQLLPERIRRVMGVCWAADRTLFYTVEDGEERPYRLYRHTLGENSDALVREENDPRYALQVRRSRSGAYVFVSAVASNATESAFVPARQPRLAPQLITRRRERHEYSVDHRGEFFFIRTNDRSPNFRLVVAKVSAPGEASWREVRAASERVALEDMAVFRDHLVVLEREGGLPHLRVAEFQGGPAEAPLLSASHRVEMPEPVYALHTEDNPSFNAPGYRFSYESLTSPTSYYEYRVRTRKLELLERAAVIDGYDPSRYREERLMARAADGTQIPISLVYRRDKPPGPNPMLLEAYGAYGYPFPTTFSSTRVSLLDRGFIHAIAHVRGGGELGPSWHEQGRRLNKRNSFGDFIAAAEQLIGSGYTKPDRLAIVGASAGGLLVATVINERPELFKAALLDVPFVDILNTMSDPELPLMEAEYDEWGNPADIEQYRYLKSYCPYTNIQRQDYPSLLVKTSYDDSEVMYWEPAKYVAKLRARARSTRPVLLWTELDSHAEREGAAADELRERAFDYAFLLAQVGSPEPATRATPAVPANPGRGVQPATIRSNTSAKTAR